MLKPAEISIKAEGLQKIFGPTKALDGLDLSLEQGLLHGIIGPDGSGKTTLLRILAGLLNPTKGKVVYLSQNIPLPFIDVRPYLGYMPSRASLYPDLSIEEHLVFFKKLYSLEEEYFRRKSKELLQITRLDKFRNRKVGQLSGGMYKKTGLMCSLLQSPSFLLLDEPTNGVDPISRREFWDLLYGLLEEKILVIVSTAYMDEAERCGQVHLLNRGKVIIEGNPGKILEERKVKDFNQVFMDLEGKREEELA